MKKEFETLRIVGHQDGQRSSMNRTASACLFASEAHAFNANASFLGTCYCASLAEAQPRKHQLRHGNYENSISHNLTLDSNLTTNNQLNNETNS